MVSIFKLRFMVKVVSVFIVQCFLVSNVAWAFTESNLLPSQKKDCLSPGLGINVEGFPMAITNAMAIYQLNDPQAFNTVLVGIHKRLINDVNKSLTLQDVINDYQVSKENAEKIMQALGALDKEFTDIAGIDFVYDSKDPEDSSKWKIRKLNMEVIAKEVFRSYDNRSNDADFYITDKVSFYIGLGQTLMQKKLYESYGIQKDISEMKMVAGMDVRWASTRIKNAYMYGMRVAGVDVTDISSDELRASTPLVYFGGWYFKDLDGGIVVTGSHMRPNGCGLKATARTQIKEGEFLVLNFDQDQQGLHKDLVLQLAQDKALRMSIKAEKTGKLIDELSIKEKIRYDYVTYLLSYFAFGSRETREILNKDESDRKVNAFNVLEQKLNNLSAEDKAKLVQLSKIGFVMDGMEGSGGDVLMLLDKRLGQLIEGLNSEMKNTNINPDFETSRDNMPDPTRGTNLKKFADYLTLKSTWDKGIRVYIGYDNDQDRIGVVISYKEASGKINYKVLNGDEIGGVVIKYLAKLYPGFKIAGVGDIKCGDVGKLSVEDAGGEYHTWITGHSWIKRKMFELERENADIISLMGFEQSGHFFIRDNFLLDDSLLTGVVLLKVIIEEFGADLDKLIEDLGVFPITPEIRPEFDAQTTGWKTKPSREELAEFKNNVIEKKVQEQFSEDKGYRLKFFGPEGKKERRIYFKPENMSEVEFSAMNLEKCRNWIVLRYSANDPVASMRLQAESEKMYDVMIKEFFGFLKQERLINFYSDSFLENLVLPMLDKKAITVIDTTTLQNVGLSRRPIAEEFLNENKELVEKLAGKVITKDKKYFDAAMKNEFELFNRLEGEGLELTSQEKTMILRIWQNTRDFRQTQAMQSDVNKKMQAIQRTMKEEDEDVKTEEGRQRLMDNWRGWVYGEQDWANEGITETVILAEKIRNDEKEAFVQVGVGGSDQTTKAIVNGTISSQHNLQTKQARGGAPQLYYTGDQFDGNITFDILEALWQQGILFKTIFDITSKSGTTAETVHTFLIIRSYLDLRLEELKANYDAGRIDEAKLSELGLTPADLQISTLRYTVKNDAGIDEQTEEKYFSTGRFFVFTTGQNEKSALFNYAKMIKEQAGDEVYGMLPVPGGTGGRYSFATAVGMLAMGVTANENKGETAENRVKEVLRAIKDVRQEMLEGEVEGDGIIPFAIARANYLAEKKFGLNILAFYPFASLMAETSNLIMQISTESIQEKGQGQNILPLVGPSRNHSVVNGIINGPRDKIVSFIKVDKFASEKDGLIKGGRIFGGDLTALEGIRQSEVQNASFEGTLEDMIEHGVPAYKITMPELTPYYLAKLIAYFQHEVAIEGQLRGLRSEADEHGVYVDLTYLQKAVEGYKEKTRTHLSIMKTNMLLTIGDLGVEKYKTSAGDLIKSSMNVMRLLQSSI